MTGVNYLLACMYHLIWKGNHSQIFCNLLWKWWFSRFIFTCSRQASLRSTSCLCCCCSCSCWDQNHLETHDLVNLVLIRALCIVRPGTFFDLQIKNFKSNHQIMIWFDDLITYNKFDLICKSFSKRRLSNQIILNLIFRYPQEMIYHVI